MTKFTSRTIIILIIVANGLIQSDAACDEHTIVDKIFTDYNPDVRPVRNQLTPIVVQFRLCIYSIVNVNEQDESISLLVWMKSVWKDEFLSWDMTESNQDCTSIKTRAKKLWTPDAVFTNMSTQIFTVFSLDITPVVAADQQWLSITNEGIVSMTTTSFVTLRCSMRISDFPFDTQKCPLDVTVWTYENKDLQLTLYHEKTSVTDVLSNSSEFHTISIDVAPFLAYDDNQTFSELHYTLVLKRIPDYYVFVIIIPSFLLTSLCIIGIFTPNSNINERNERVTLGLTTLLSMAVILNIVADQMPKSSEGLPLLGYFILYEIAMCTLAIILATIVLFVHQRAHTRAYHVPRVLYWLTRTKPLQNNSVFQSHFQRYYTPIEDQKRLQHEVRRESKQVDTSDQITQMLTVAKATCGTLQMVSSMIERKIDGIERREAIERVWMKTVDLIDIFLLITLLIANSALTFSVFR